MLYYHLHLTNMSSAVKTSTNTIVVKQTESQSATDCALKHTGNALRTNNLSYDKAEEIKVHKQENYNDAQSQRTHRTVIQKTSKHQAEYTLNKNNSGYFG